MKKYIISCIIGATLLMSSCSADFLNQFPESDLTANTFYKTKAHYDQAVASAYVGLRTVAYKSFFIDEMRSDNAHYDHYAGDRGPYLNTEVIALFEDNNTDGMHIRDTYNECYKMIQRINTALDRMGTSNLTEPEKAAATAELKFLRAYYYFVLNRNWSGVPLMLKEVVSEADAFIARSTEAEVYEQILKDIEPAITALPNPTPSGTGKATKGSALMLRAAVYLQMVPGNATNAAKAEADLKALAGLGYDLMPTYGEIFLLGNKNNKESIFEVQYIDDMNGNHNAIPWRLIPKCSNNQELMGVAQANTDGESGGWVVPEDNLLRTYEDGDQRLNASVGVVLGTVDGAGVIKYRKISDYENFRSEMLDGESYKIFCRKYYHPPYKNTGYRAGDNIVLYRYGTALLMLAEALVIQNKSAEALPYVNRVRARAGLPALASVTAEDVLMEQRHENAFEMHRWSELKRYNKVESAMTLFGTEMKAKYGYILPTAFSNLTKRKAYPFHFRELDVNSKLEQNPGYN